MNCDCPFCSWVRQVFIMIWNHNVLCLKSPKTKCVGSCAWPFVCSYWECSSLLLVGVSSYSPVQLRMFSLMGGIRNHFGMDTKGHSEAAYAMWKMDFSSHLIWFNLKDELGTVTGGKHWRPASGSYQTFTFPGQLSFCSSPSMFNAVSMIQQAQHWEECQTGVYSQPCLLCPFTCVCYP